MATIQLGNTKVANRLISYAEKRSEVREGVLCPAEYAKAQFKATRELWGKTDGIQAHHIIQSFKPGEVSPEMANQIGQDLAKEIAKGHEAVIYTHTDKEHIHNHIVINSVNFENGKKYQSSKKDLYKIREVSDRLCLERDLSVVKEPSAHTRYTLAEKSLLEKGKDSWKDEIRECIDHTRGKVRGLDDLADKLKKEFDIETKITNKNISFKHPDSERFVRGKKLGLAYEKETLVNEFERKIERGQERGTTDLPSSAGFENGRIETTHEGDKRAEQSHEKLYSSSYEQRRSKSNDDGPRVIENQKDQSRRSRGNGFNQSGHSRQNDFNLEQARQHAKGLRKSVSHSYGEWQKGDGSHESKDPSTNGRHRGKVEQRYGEIEQQNEQKHEQSREKGRGFNMER